MEHRAQSEYSTLSTESPTFRHKAQMHKRYLKERGNRRHAQIPIPTPLRRHFGGKHCFEKALGTDSLIEARQRRDVLLTELRGLFGNLLAAEPGCWNPQRIALKLRAQVAAGTTTPLRAEEALEEDLHRHALNTDPERLELTGDDAKGAQDALAIVHGRAPTG